MLAIEGSESRAGLDVEMLGLVDVPVVWGIVNGGAGRAGWVGDLHHVFCVLGQKFQTCFAAFSDEWIEGGRGGAGKSLGVQVGERHDVS